MDLIWVEMLSRKSTDLMEQSLGACACGTRQKKDIMVQKALPLPLVTSVELRHIKIFKSLLQIMNEIVQHQTEGRRSAPPAGAQGEVLIEKRGKQRKESFDWSDLGSCLIWESLTGICDWLLLSFIFLDSSTLILAEVLVCLCRLQNKALGLFV